MRKILVLILSLMLIYTTAFAAPIDEYKLTNLQSPPIDAMLNITFGDDAGKAVNSQFRGGMADFYLIDDFYEIPNNKDNVWFGYTVAKKDPNQSSLSSFMDRMDINNTERISYWHYNGPENVEPSGEAKGTLNRADAIKRADDILTKLGFDNFSFVNAVAFGAQDIPKGEKYPNPFHYYEVLYRQNINGLPIYLSSPFFEYDNMSKLKYFMDSLNAKITVSDEKVNIIEINVSQAIPQNKNLKDIGEQKAIEIFNKAGINADEAELCYLAIPLSNSTIALPAYRYLNNYINASNGKWLQ